MLCMRQAVTKTMALSLRNDARGTRGRRSLTPPPSNPLYADGSRRENLGRQRRHELRMGILTTNRPILLASDRRSRDLKQGPAGTGLISRTWALVPERNAFCILTGPSPPFTNRKENHKYPGPATPYDATPTAVPPPRISPQDVSRTEREFVMMMS